MSVLKIKDAHGNWVGIPSIKGEKGDRGEQGIQGIQGERGLTGATFTPSVSSAGVISWTNDGGKQNPSTVDLVAAIPTATTQTAGKMSATDKGRLDTLYADYSSALTALGVS